MAEFNLWDDEDYDNIFITQSSNSENPVSLEESSQVECLKDDKYSDISDDEQDCMIGRLR